MHFQNPSSGIQLCYRQVIGCQVNQRQNSRYDEILIFSAA